MSYTQEAGRRWRNAGSTPARSTNYNMKSTLVTIGIILLGILSSIHGERIKQQQKDIEELKTRVTELSIVVDQKFLPAMILDKEHLGVR